MEIYLFIIVLVVVFILGYLAFQLIQLIKTKDELIRQVTLALSEVLTIAKMNEKVYEEPAAPYDDEPAFNPHEYPLEEPDVE